MRPKPNITLCVVKGSEPKHLHLRIRNLLAMALNLEEEETVVVLAEVVPVEVTRERSATTVEKWATFRVIVGHLGVDLRDKAPIVEIAPQPKEISSLA